jgi:hypothetical protein
VEQIVPDSAREVVLGDELADELRSVTLEEFRLTEARYETDTRLGRELLYLSSNAEWTRRTTEVVDVSRVSAAETRLTVDVDTSYIAHEALRGVDGPLWLPLFTLPGSVPDPDAPSAATGAVESPIGVDITDAQGVRVAGVPQAEVRRHLAAALAETLVIRLARRPADPAEQPELVRYGRDHQVLLAAMLAQLLTRPPDDARVPAPAADGPAPVDDGTRLGRARADLHRWLATDRALLRQEQLPGAGSVLASREAEVVQALRGNTFVVVPVQPGPPTSFTMVTPSRPLVGSRRAGASAVQVRVAVLAPTTHADRVIEVLLPDGVRLREETSRSSAAAVVDVATPAQFEQLRTLLLWIFDPATGGWPRKQLAELAGTKLEAAVQSLQHHYDAYPAAGEDGTAPVTAAVLDELVALREPLTRLATIPQYVPAREPAADERERPEFWVGRLAESWPRADELLLTLRLRRRVDRSTTSPGSVRFRASAIEEFTLRAQPEQAYVEVVLESRESQVLGTAAAVNRITGLVLFAVSALLLFDPLESENGPAVLAALLTFFPAIQASRLRQPDSTRLAGLLSMEHFTAGLATAVPGLLLAGILAFEPTGPTVKSAAVAALLGQVGCHLWIRALQRSGAGRAGPIARRIGGLRPPLVLRTVRSPDQRRVDVLRTAWCRSLTGDVLLLGRSAHPYVVVDDNSPDSFARLLAGAQGAVQPDGRLHPNGRRRLLDAIGSRLDRPARDPGDELGDLPASNIVGVLRGMAVDRSVTFLIFRDPPRHGWESAEDGNRAVTQLNLEQGQVAPMEPPDWVLDAMVGFLPGDLAGVGTHPLTLVARTAARSGFTLLNVQLPAPPLQGEPERQWLRARIGVPYRRGGSLRGLVTVLQGLQELRNAGIRVHLREVPPTESLDATQTAPEDPFDAPPGTGPGGAPMPERRGAPVTDRELLVRGLPDARWRLIAVCAPPYSGMVASVLTALAEDDSVAALAGVVSGVLNGSLAVFVLCRLAPGAPAGDAADREANRRLAGHPVLAGRSATVTVLRGVPWPRPEPAAPRALLRVQIHTPDRPGVLQDLLRALGRYIEWEAGRDGPAPDVPEVDVLYALTPVVDGQAISGRMLIRLPRHPGGPAGWDAVRWAEVGRRVAQSVTGQGGTALVDAERTLRRSDDTVVSLDLIRRP